MRLVKKIQYMKIEQIYQGPSSIAGYALYTVVYYRYYFEQKGADCASLD